jgi:hypothetical protein
MMRWLLAWSVSILGACDLGGAHVTLVAPDGPDKVTSLRVVLASPADIATVEGQRVRPDALDTHAVTYFRQRTTAGAIRNLNARVDGYALRVDPDPAIADSAFIPFLLLYDASGAITGVATFYADEAPALPAPIRVPTHEIAKYELMVDPVTQIFDDLEPLANGQVRVVDCYGDDQRAWPSGLVWRTRQGTELRLLLAEPGEADATGRALDLDCDGRALVANASSGDDCDDTRGWFHAGAVETCDGYDTNCDGIETLAVPCTGPNVCGDPSTQTGVALCDDRTGTVGDTCYGDPQCLCANGAAGCTRCHVLHTPGAGADSVVACQPAVGSIKLYGCTDSEPCTVSVLGAHGGWKAEIARTPTEPFGLIVTGASHQIALEIRRHEGPLAEITGARNTSTGQVDLAVSSGGITRYVGVDLWLTGELSTTTCSGSGPFDMYCFP